MVHKIENWTFYIFLSAIPISLRHIFGYEPFGFVEWIARYIYATDILLIILLLFCFRNSGIKNLFKIQNLSVRQAGLKFKITKADWFLLAFVLVAGLSTNNAIDMPTAVFQWVKLVEGVALYFYVKDYALFRFNFSNGFEALVIGGTFQAIIGIAQFMKQGSLGLKYLGESVLVPAMSGIASFYVNGIKIMRAYGTTPHSNVLALYLFLILAISTFYDSPKNHKKSWYLFYIIILWAFFLTFSRTIIGLWMIYFVVLSLVSFYKFKKFNLKVFWTTITVCVTFAAVYWPYVTNRATISNGDEAIQLRTLYNHESLASGSNLLGLGLGNFVPWLMTQNLHLERDLYQPVHNIYLLIYSETGIAGISLFLIFMALLLYDFYNRLDFRKLHHFSFGLIIISVLIVGLFDHFLWTIQSGRLLFWLMLGLTAGAE